MNVHSEIPYVKRKAKNQQNKLCKPKFSIRYALSSSAKTTIKVQWWDTFQ